MGSIAETNRLTSAHEKIDALISKINFLEDTTIKRFENEMQKLKNEIMALKARSGRDNSK